MTGARGYVGSRLVAKLTESPSVLVRALVRERVHYLPKGTQIVVDLTGDSTKGAAAFDGVDVVVHLAGANEVLANDQPERALTETILATQRVAQWAAAAGARRIVYLSTVHVYGGAMTEEAQLSEETVPSPRSIYAIARLASEYLVSSASSAHMSAVVLRLTNSIGAPTDVAVNRWSLVANDLCRQGALDERLELRSHGVQWRDFVALSDVTDILSAATQPDFAPPGTYNLGSGQPRTVRSLAEMVQDVFEELTGRRPELRAPAPPKLRPAPYQVRVDRLAGYGWLPQTPIRSAVLETARFCLDHRETL